MRIWSLHPSYLDVKGLVALWRETLLAKKVLEGNTKGYKNHPQLNRFKEQQNPIAAINKYLEIIWREATARGYKFNREKFTVTKEEVKIPVTKGQLQFEFEHLLGKLKQRDHELFLRFKTLKDVEAHPLFRVIDGGISDWERI